MAVKSYALTTRQRLIDFLGLTGLTSTQNSVLDRIIDSVTEFIENYTGRRFKQTTYTNELYDGDGSEYLLLKNYPVNSASSFTLSRRDSVVNESSWSSIDSEDYFVDYDTGIVEYAGGLRFASQPKHYRVTYTAGYNYDNSSTFLSDTEAGDIEYIAWKLCAVAWARRQGDPSIASESIGDYSVSYTKEAFENDEVKSVLDKYSSVSAYGVRT